MIPKPITISITDSHGRRFTAELHYDSNIEDIMNAIEALVIGAGYSTDWLKDYILECAEERQYDRKNCIQHPPCSCQ